MEKKFNKFSKVSAIPFWTHLCNWNLIAINRGFQLTQILMYAGMQRHINTASVITQSRSRLNNSALISKVNEALRDKVMDSNHFDLTLTIDTEM